MAYTADIYKKITTGTSVGSLQFASFIKLLENNIGTVKSSFEVMFSSDTGYANFITLATDVNDGSTQANQTVFVASDGSLKYKDNTGAISQLSNQISVGSLTSGYVPYYNGSALVNSNISTDGTNFTTTGTITATTFNGALNGRADTATNADSATDSAHLFYTLVSSGNGYKVALVDASASGYRAGIFSNSLTYDISTDTIGANISGNSATTNDLADGHTLSVAKGGTGATNFGSGQLLWGQGTAQVGSDGQLAWDNSSKVLTTANLTVAGMTKFGESSYSAGSAQAYTTATSGLVIIGKTGTVTDFGIGNGSGNDVLDIPTGTTNVRFYGSISIANPLAVSSGGTGTSTLTSGSVPYYDGSKLTSSLLSFSSGYAYLYTNLNTNHIQSIAYASLVLKTNTSASHVIVEGYGTGKGVLQFGSSSSNYRIEGGSEFTGINFWSNGTQVGKFNDSGNLSLTNPLAVSSGGTGASSFTSGYVPYYNGSVLADSSLFFSSGSAYLYGNLYANHIQSISDVAVLIRTNSSSANVIIEGAGNQQGVLQFGSSYVSYKIAGGVDYGGLRFYTGATERMYIDNSGNLGIGRAPTNDRLEVEGNILITNNYQLEFGNSGNTNNKSFITGYSSANGSFEIATVHDYSRFSYSNGRQSGNITYSYNGSTYFQVPYGINAVVGTTFTVNGNTYTVVKSSVSSHNGYSYVYVTPSASGEASTGTLVGLSYTTERFVIDTSGNLGIGVNPSSWHYTHRAIDLPSGSLVSDHYSTYYSTLLGTNAYFKSSDAQWKYSRSGEGATLYTQQNRTTGVSGHFWFVAPSGTAGSTVPFTNVMTLDSSGNLGIGLTPSTWFSGKAIELGSKGNAIWGLGENNIQFVSNFYFDGGYKFANSSGYANWLQVGAASGKLWFGVSSTSSTGVGGAITWNQVFSTDTSGNLSIANSTYSGRYCNSGGFYGTAEANAKNHFNQTNSGNVAISTGWISSAFGDTNGIRVVIGQADGKGLLGAHTGNLDTWSSLSIVGEVYFRPTESPTRGTIMHLTNSGNLGIGRTPTADRLEVEGNVLITNDNILEFGSSGNTNNKSFITGFSGYNGSFEISTPHDYSRFSYSNGRQSGNIAYSYNGGTYFQIPYGINAVVGTTFTVNGNTYTVTNSSVSAHDGHSYVYVTPSAGGEASTGTLIGLSYTTERFVIDTSGNLGIGTSPSQKLDVMGNIQMQKAGTTSDIYGALIWKSPDISSNYRYALMNEENGSGGCSFVLKHNGGTERLRVDNSGNLGIGTSPSARLHVHQNVSGTSVNVSTEAGGVGIKYGELKFYSTAFTSGYTNYGASIASYSASGVDSGDLRFYTSHITVGSGRREVGRFDHFGNFGIGTTAPGSKLSVYGGYAMAYFHDSDNTTDLQISGSGATTTRTIIGTVANASLAFKTYNTEWMTLDTYGTLDVTALTIAGVDVIGDISTALDEIIGMGL